MHDKVYNASSFVDEHPYVSSPPPLLPLPIKSDSNNNNHHSGGEEVLIDVGGQDATEAFEDVGHSDEAREILDGLLVGPLKRQVSSSFHFPPPSPCAHFLPSNHSLNRGYAFPKKCDLMYSLTTPHQHQASDPAPSTSSATKPASTSTSSGAGMGVGLYAVILVGVVVAFGAYRYMQAQSEK